MTNFFLDILRATKPGRAIEDVQNKDALRNLASQMSGVPTDGSIGPAQPLDRQSALARYGQITGDLSPALGIGGQNIPSDIQSYNFFAKLTPEQQAQFLNVKRSTQIIDAGGKKLVYDPMNPQQPLASFEMTPPPQDMPEFINQQEDAKQRAILKSAAPRAKATATGTAQGEAENQLANLESGLPSLSDSIQRASLLAEDATYTKGGKLYDLLQKEVLGKTTMGAKSKAGFDSIINNEVIPQLKQMLGTQFTERDREFAVKTMADTNSTPEEKQVQLSTYMQQRLNNISSLRRRVRKNEDLNADTSIFDGVSPNNPPNLPKQVNSPKVIRYDSQGNRL